VDRDDLTLTSPTRHGRRPDRRKREPAEPVSSPRGRRAHPRSCGARATEYFRLAGRAFNATEKAFGAALDFLAADLGRLPTGCAWLAASSRCRRRLGGLWRPPGAGCRRKPVGTKN